MSLTRRAVLSAPLALLVRKRRRQPVGWKVVTVIAPLVIVQSGIPNTGLFVYNGKPAKGSLVAAVVAPGTTSDPFGNTVGAVANFGKWSAAGALLQHFGVDQNGDTYLANAAGKTVVHEHSADGSEWFYTTAGEGLGNLVESIAPAGGTDLAGNTYYAGIVNYSTLTSAIAQLLNGFLNVGTAAQMAGTGGATPGQIGLLTANPGVVRMDSGLSATGDSDAFVDVRSKNAQSAISAVAQRNITLAGPLALSVEGSTPLQLAAALLYSDTTGFLRMLAGASGDTTVYQLGQAVYRMEAAQTISATTFTTFNDGTGNVTSQTVDAGKYHFEAFVRVTQGAVANAAGNVGFSGPAASFTVWQNMAGQATFAPTIGTVQGTLTTVNFLGAIAANTEEYIWITGETTFSASGTFAMGGVASAGHSFTCQPGTKFIVRPVQ